MKKTLIVLIMALLAVTLIVSCEPEPKMFTVSFDSNGGTAVQAQTITDGEKVSEPTNPTKTGYIFQGWYDGDNAFDFSTAITEDYTLKAKWKRLYVAGDTVNFGTYPANYAVDEDLRGDAVTWKVLSVDTANSRMLVISERILETDRQFNNSSSSSSYSGSSIQSYLRNEFITKYGLSDVNMCNVDVTSAIETTTVGSGSDKVFLLSKTEVENTSYFADAAARIAYYKENNSRSWWLRSAIGSYAYSVTSDGTFDGQGTPSYNGGLRPAFWVNF